ncbi:purine-cytosine permease family protein [[Mycobacterium] burgundiense]|uniref:Cytosine permease n=1 Tax=[Mycobacterium] burgundiense TaxID=3064286 RepID=A0ABM9LBX0_9MYCO|nr:cytosine permease [Mycolicibacterium sp. MU0053]CAJ1496410.1 cytosine permease [Mycolicibacterium sp. MU0053]
MIEDTNLPETGLAARPSETIGIVETRSIDYIPLAERHGKVWHLSTIWFTGNVHILTVALGFIGIALGANLLWTAIAIVTGCAFGTFFMAFHSTQGPQLGLPQMVQSRPQFGFAGAFLVWIVALIIYGGYAASIQILVGDTLEEIVGLPTTIGYFGIALVAMLLAVVGHDLIHRAARCLSLLMVIVLAIFTIGIIMVQPFSAGAFDIRSFSLVPFMVQFFTAAAYQLSYSIFVSDYSRYLEPNVGVRETFWWTYAGAAISGAWMMLIGAAAASMFPLADTVGAVISSGDAIIPGFGNILLIAAIIPAFAAVALCFYGGSLTLLSCTDSIKQIRPSPSKRLFALACLGIITTVIAYGASGSFITWLGNFLFVLGYLLTPWTAINLIDFYVVRRGHYSIREIFNPSGMYGRWSWRGLTAYFIGFASMLPFAVVGDFHGVFARILGGVDVSMLVGLAVSSVIYLTAHRGFDLNAEIERIRVADIGIDSSAAPQ